ncbi:hypothetical protein ANN_17856 [Periplaneta americana]|uniref:DDE-1 domain-containing protein n=1 Tax=Periplaneta americana TaxID=6978 RepID=A0ABQ8SU45_PERAM|nr:hypothetical protein ANN_17856 [Periplaneta americana]
MVFGEMRPRIRHRLPGIHRTVGENLGKNPTRVFRLLLRPDGSVFSRDVVFESSSGRQLQFDPGKMYAGTLEGCCPELSSRDFVAIVMVLVICLMDPGTATHESSVVVGRPLRGLSLTLPLNKCISAITEKRMSQREAARFYKIPRSSIILKMKALRTNNVTAQGRKCVFTPEKEEAFVDHAVALCEFGFPITSTDLRFIVESYLDSTGRKETRFQKNFPGKRWAKGFLSRDSKELSIRVSGNIKRNRAIVSDEILNKYFDNMESELKDVPPTHIWNFDETNLSDDPGKMRVITKRGCKYPEAVKNSSKAAVSIMMCGNANGVMCPPYVCYKAERIYDYWIQGGPKGGRYNRTKSGWFDSVVFEDWFCSVLLPRLKKLEERKVISDNLSSHINVRVLNECKRHQIAFIALPANSTHLTQPLDVAYFRSLKSAWRSIMTDWKSSGIGRRQATIPKAIFPELMGKLVEWMKPKSEENMKSGFRKAGIYPIDRQKVLSRLPSANVFKMPH